MKQITKSEARIVRRLEKIISWRNEDIENNSFSRGMFVGFKHALMYTEIEILKRIKGEPDLSGFLGRVV